MLGLQVKAKHTKNSIIIQKSGLTSTCWKAKNCILSGLGKLIPPLAGADYLRDNLASSVCGIKYGLNGEIVVNGITYNQPMPANPTLKNLDIAQIITYVGNTWGNEIGLIETEQIVEILENCEGQD